MSLISSAKIKVKSEYLNSLLFYYSMIQCNPNLLPSWYIDSYKNVPAKYLNTSANVTVGY